MPPAAFDITFRTIEVSAPRFESNNLRLVTAKSAAMGQRVDMSVHVPPSAKTVPNVPLVILLHGVYGSHWGWTLSGGAHKTSERLIDSGEIPPFVLAMPSDGLWGDGSGYIPHRIQNFEQWIVSEVPAAAAHAAPNITPDSPVFIAGLSMGGFGALRIAAKYPGRFCAASGLSSITHFEQLKDFVQEPLSAFESDERDHSVFTTMLRNRAQLPPIRFDCGTEDTLIHANRELHTKLLTAGIPHTYEEFPGSHEWPYWETHLADTLRFFASVLRA